MRSSRPLSCAFLEPLLKERNAFASLTDAILQLDRRSEGSEEISRETYTLLLRQCSSSKSIWHGKKIHAHIVHCGKEGDTLLGNLIVQMYARCGCMDEAQAAFDRIARPNVFSWNVMLSGFAQNGDSVLARRLLQLIPQQNSSSFSIVIALCSDAVSIDETEALFARVPEHDVISWNSMLAAYATKGFLQTASRMFDRMPERNQFSWAVLIRELAGAGQPDSAADLFNLMPVKRISLYHIILAGFSTSNRGSGSSSIFLAKSFFDSIQHPDMVSCNVMITAYASKGYPNEAKIIFDGMRERDVVSWNSIVSMNIKNGELDHAGSAFDRMPQQNVITGSAMLYAYALKGQSDSAVKIFNTMPQRNLFPWNTLLSAFVRDGAVESARDFFHRMPSWDVISWSTLIAAFAKNGYPQQAKIVFDTMPARSIMSWNAMISGYSLTGLLQNDSVPLFDRMPMHDPVSWTSMVSGFAQNGDGASALGFFRRMEIEGIQPEESTFVSLLDACASLADVVQGRLIHEEISHSDDAAAGAATVTGSLVNMYAKCGHLSQARAVFDGMSDRSAPSWNTMIAGYAQNGRFGEALDLFTAMQHHGTTPTFISYIVVLSACSHLGDLELGIFHFVSMQGYGIQPVREHYVCMVDLLSRVGKLDAAHDFVAESPIENDAGALIALLTGCKNQGVTQGAERVADSLFRMDEQWSAPYVLLSNLHAESWSS